MFLIIALVRDSTDTGRMLYALPLHFLGPAFRCLSWKASARISTSLRRWAQGGSDAHDCAVLGLQGTNFLSGVPRGDVMTVEKHLFPLVCGRNRSDDHNRWSAVWAPCCKL